jgi:hypothetical protein
MIPDVSKWQWTLISLRLYNEPLTSSGSAFPKARPQMAQTKVLTNQLMLFREIVGVYCELTRCTWTVCVSAVLVVETATALRSALFWHFTQRRIVVSYSRFGKSEPYSRIKQAMKKAAWPLKTGHVYISRNVGKNYTILSYVKSRNHGSYSPSGGRLKSRKLPDTAVPTYPLVIHSKTYRGYVKPRIIPNAIRNVIFV